MCSVVGSSGLERGNETIKEVDMGVLGDPIIVSHALSCTSKEVVYLAKNLKSGKVYFGQTGREIRHRVREHINDIENKDERKPISRHFVQTNSSRQDFWCIPIAKVVGGKEIRESVESALIKRYKTVLCGLNERD